MSATTSQTPAPATERLLTIGAVVRDLTAEFDDISISKIRYLEGEGLVTPKRTRGGYRLFSEEDVERLRTILRLQRDEFLPLRVIRQELLAPTAPDRRRRRTTALQEREQEFEPSERCERAEISAELARELEDFGLLAPRTESRRKLYSETDVEVATMCARLSQYGVAPRHLRAFRTGVEREVALLGQVVAPALRARTPERRQAGVEELQLLGALAQELSQLLFWRELRRIAGT